MITALKRKKLPPSFEFRLADLDIPREPAALYDPVRYTFALGGKRVRFCITMLSCGLSGGKPDDAIHSAYAIETLHNFTLLHDDVMDNAEIRRGETSVNKKWGTSYAILSGDILFVKAFEYLSRYRHHRRYADIMDLFIKASREVCEGQAMDIDFEHREDVTAAEYMQMIKGKTAALFKAAMAMGGMVAGAGATVIKNLENIGEEVGIAFQIQDDLLDIIGNPYMFGKENGKDLKESKKTFPVLLTLQRCNVRERIWLLRHVNSNPVSDEDIKRYLYLFKKYNVIEDTRSVIDNHFQQAFRKITKFDDSKYNQELINLIEYVKNRDF